MHDSFFSPHGGLISSLKIVLLNKRASTGIYGTPQFNYHLFLLIFMCIYIIAHKCRQLYNITCYKRADDNLTVM